MDHVFQTFFPYIMTILGVVLLIMVKTLLKTNSTNSEQITILRKDFNDLLLNLAKLTPTFMDVNACSRVRNNCIDLNKKIILEPIQKQLDSFVHEREEKWKGYDDEVEQIWISLQNHIHTDSGVVVRPRKA